MITNSYATGNVNGGEGDDYVGGLVGQQTGGTITNSYATGEGEWKGGNDRAGGLVGTGRRRYNKELCSGKVMWMERMVMTMQAAWWDTRIWE